MSRGTLFRIRRGSGVRTRTPTTFFGRTGCRRSAHPATVTCGPASHDRRTRDAIAGYADALSYVQQSAGSESYQPDRDAHGWVRFCLRAHHLQAQMVERRLEIAREVWRVLHPEAQPFGIENWVL
jgi:hypothetical protein